MVEEFFDDSFQVMNIEFSIAFAAAPKKRTTLTGERDGEATFFFRSGIALNENTANLKKSDVIISVADIMAQGIEQSRQQTRTQHVHIAAQWIGQWQHDASGCKFAGGIGNQCLPLR